MPDFLRVNRRGTRLFALLVTTLSLVAGCGLGMDSTERLERARTAFAASEYRAAVIDTKNVLQSEPENREARLLLGRSSLKLNDAATAEKELHRAVSLGVELAEVAVDLGQAMLALRQHEQLLEEIAPEVARTDADRLSILNLRAQAMLALGRPADARAVYQEVLAANADDRSALLGVASTHVAETDYAQARTAVDRALAVDASYVPARLASGSLFMATGDHGAAVEDFSQAAELAVAKSSRPEEIAALSGLIEAQLVQRDVVAAKEALVRLEQLAPDNLATLYLTARVAFLEEDYELAQSELQRVLAVAPQSGPAQFLMGAVQLQRGNLGQAEMHLSSVVAASPANADARKLLAEIRLRQDRADEAADILRPLVQAPDADLGAINLAVRASLAVGEVDNAIGYLRQAHENDPENADVQLDLAAAYLSAGEIEEAEALLASAPGGTQRTEYRRELLQVMAPLRREDSSTALADAQAMAERWPEDARVRNLIGGIALAMGDNELARASFVEAQRLAPDELSTYLNIAGIDLRQGDLDGARAQYEAALERQRESAPLMVALAKVEARAERMDVAVDWLAKARAADTAALPPRLLLARVYLDKGAFEAAAGVAGEAVALDAASAEAHDLLGLAQQGRGETATAIASFSEAERLAPEESLYRLHKARAEAALGELEQAEQTLLGSDGLDLDDIRSSVMVAALRAKEGDTAAAMKIAKDLQARHPDRAVPYALEAELLAAAAQYTTAAAAYDKALSLRGEDRRLAVRAFRVRNAGGLDDPEAPLLDYLGLRPLDTDMRVIVAQHYHAAGNSGRAVAEYERVLETAPDNSVALNNLAWEYFVGGDARAEALARRAYEQSPENGSVADTLGWIQVNKGNLEEGIPNLRKAVELSDGNPEVAYHLAAGLAAAGQAEEARRILEETLSGTAKFASRVDAEQLLDSL